MNNQDIAKSFQLLGELMELHGENPFKIRSYQNAYLTLRKLATPLSNLTEDELEAIPGVGKAIASKIRELCNTGKLETLEKYRAGTPPGVEELLNIKGLGPKKLRVIWKELGVESLGELQYALNENRLLELKGFGKKTQDEVQKQLDFYKTYQNQFLYASLEVEAQQLLEQLAQLLPGIRVEWTGALRRRDPVLDEITILIGSEQLPQTSLVDILEFIEQHQEGITGKTKSGFPVKLLLSSEETFVTTQFIRTAEQSFLEGFLDRLPTRSLDSALDEATIFQRAGLDWIAPELREGTAFLSKAISNTLPALIEASDIKGVVHTHSTYSDGINSIRDMARHAAALGYTYLVITDHSKSAFYANGLSVERLQEQWKEIDQLNQELAPFQIFKGIESDILYDGSLDYTDDILEQFDLVIASVHSQLKMDEAKATARLLQAIAHPCTRILGHPTGRLLLSRSGYPIDHKQIIDACRDHRVAIELNANPYRLDLDYRWIQYAIEQEVPISINPDAHSISGIKDIHYGVLAARKGGLTRAHCLNSRDAAEFKQWIQSRHL